MRIIAYIRVVGQWPLPISRLYHYQLCGDIITILVAQHCCRREAALPMHCQYHLAAVFAAFEYNRLCRPKVVVERHFGLDVVEVGIAHGAGGGDKRQIDCAAESRFGDEPFSSVEHFSILLLVDFILAGGIFHLAYVCRVIGALDKKVYLCAVFRSGLRAPGVLPRHDSGDAEFPLDLLHVGEADALEGQSAPDIGRRGVLNGDPGTRFFRIEISEKSEMEKREIVHKSVYGVARVLSRHSVAADETAFRQFGKGLPESSVVVKARR